CDVSVDLAHAVDDAPHPRARDCYVEARLDGERAGPGEGMEQVALEHRAPSVGTSIEPQQVTASHVPGGEGLVHRGAELRGARRADVGGLQLVRRRRHAKNIGVAIAHRAYLEV